MAIFKKKTRVLPIAVLAVLVSLSLAVWLPAVAENGGQQDSYIPVVAVPNNAEHGSVEIESIDDNGEGEYRYGTDVILTAVPKGGYKFVRWEGSSVSTSNPLRIPVVEACSYTAVFEPLTYNISYENNRDMVYAPGTVIPEKHTYGQTTLLPIPTDTPGHTFKGWRAESGGVVKDYIKGASLGADDYQADIFLYPLFEENNYEVTCYDVSESGELLGEQVKEYAYGVQTVPLADWATKTYNGFTHDPAQYKDLENSVMVNTSLNQVYRVYKMNSYTVKLDRNAADAEGGLETLDVVYSQNFPKIDVEDLPTRKGYVCLGYFLDSNGNGVYDQNADSLYCKLDAHTKAWTVYEFRMTDSDFTRISGGEIVLKALWEKVNYALSFSYNTLSGSSTSGLVSIKVEGADGTDYSGKTIPYDTQVTITVTVNSAYKLVKWNGTSVKHSNQSTFDFTVPDRDTEMTLTVLPDDERTPAFAVDYQNEKLGDLTAGTFRLECGEEVFTFDGEVGVSLTPYLGKTVYLIRCGDGETVADSDAQTIVLASRPDKVTLDKNVYLTRDEKTVTIVFPDGIVPDGLEFACSAELSEREDGSDLVWQKDCVFGNLQDGTPYHVYVRVAATDSAPHGLCALVGYKITPYDAYVREQIDYIISLMRQGIVGVNVQSLIDKAKADLNALEASETFYNEANAIVADVESKLPHARVKDQAIADLTAKYNELIQSGKYGESLGIPQLDTLYNTAHIKICAAETDGVVEDIRLETLKAFDLVPISYLTVDDDMKLYAEKGMDKAYSLSMKSGEDDLATLAAKIRRAINAGTIVPGGVSMTYTDIKNALKTMDVLGYYRLKLDYQRDAEIHHPAQGPYEIRLLLPDGLRDDTGFMVAYYNESTEELTVLETAREGNWLIFKAPQSVEDFVILGDHAVNMIGVCAALSVALLAQIVAVVLIVSRRRKNKKEMRLNGFAIPAFALTVRFYPVPVTNAVAILAGLVVIMQIVLMWLLVKTDVVPIRRRRHRSAEPVAEEAALPTESEPAAEEAYAPVSDEDAEVFYEDEEILVEDAVFDGDAYADDENAAESEDGQVYGDEQPYEDGAAEEWNGEEDFIEPAPNPNYSLPDDEFQTYEESENGEEINGYSMEYDGEANGYQLEYDNEPVEYTDEEFDGEGEGFVEYEDADGYESAEFEAEDEAVDYGYDMESASDDTEVVYDYVTAEDVVRDEDYVPYADGDAQDPDGTDFGSND